MQKFVIDYLTFSYKSSEKFEYFIEYFHVDREKLNDGYSFYGLKHCYKYITGMKFHVDEDQDLFILDFSGKGCRLAETIMGDGWDWSQLIREILPDIRSKFCHISRIDFACDLFDDTRITLPFLTRYVEQGKYICKSKDHLITAGNKESAIYFGSPTSDRRLRIYDKAKEQGIGEQLKWVRFELQMRNDCAISFVLNLELCNFDWVSCYLGVLRNYVNFVTKKNTGTQTGRLRRCPWWLRFLQGKDALKQLYLPGEEYTLKSLHRFLYQTAGSSLKLALEVHHGDLSYILEAADLAKLNPKQQAVLDKYLLEQMRLNTELEDIYAKRKQGLIS